MSLELMVNKKIRKQFKQNHAPELHCLHLFTNARVNHKMTINGFCIALLVTALSKQHKSKVHKL